MLSRVARWSAVSHLLYVVLVLLIAIFTTISCAFLISQAVRHAPNQSFKQNINVIIVGASYVVLLLVSIAFCLKRRIAVHKRLQRISETFHTLGKSDVPESVHKYIQQEYTRACLIAYESRPKGLSQDGWGKPGTALDGLRFRTALLDSVRVIDSLAHEVIPRHPVLRPHARMLHHFRFIMPLMSKDEDGLTPLHYYDSANEFLVGITAAREIENV
ncbi:uncharacterized protein BXZ73DRAFT_87344 [Epithele typhae]|uniref:uncharacterized protein n=1 Tax=Epithele typhae TaxID=378194 RepID=UPI00200893C9|nr:uncharacterized protein BXZ73DRAFT_87344 [Epithele typhae]KAH9944448.1 hypothetical protein BXZ73DRAFT_87344 [Epithele typhae]